MYGEDERRAWITLFKSTGDIIPCPTCKEHFLDYFKEHSIDELKTLPLSQLHDWVRDWFWTVHNWVNETLGKPEFSKEELATAYAGINVRAALAELDVPMKRAIVLSGYNQKKFADWRSKVFMLFSILGV